MTILKGKTMRHFTTPRVIHMFCVAIGVVIGVSAFFGDQQSFGQSVGNAPRKTAEMIKLESSIKEMMGNQKQIEDDLEKTIDKRSRLATEAEGLKQLGSKMSVSAESYPEVLKTLHSQRVQLLIDLAGIDARYQAIENAIAQVTKRKSDAVLASLQQLVDVRSAELARLIVLKEKGSISSSEVRAAEIALLESKTRLAQVNSTKGGVLAHLNAQLLDTSLEKAEKAARLAKVGLLITEVDAYRVHASKLNENFQQQGSLGREMNNSQRELEYIKNVISQQKTELEKLLESPQ